MIHLSFDDLSFERYNFQTYSPSQSFSELEIKQLEENKHTLRA
jgi:hypothetical protein